MKKTLFLMMTLALLMGQAVASPVGVEQARHIGMKYVQSHSARQAIELNLAYTEVAENGNPAVYVFNFDHGFVLVSADDVARPILAFSDEESVDPNNMPDGFASTCASMHARSPMPKPITLSLRWKWLPNGCMWPRMVSRTTTAAPVATSPPC